MAVAGVFKESERSVALAPLKLDGNADSVSDRDGEASDEARRLSRRLQIGDVNLLLTRSEFRRLTQLTGGDVDEGDLTDVLGLLTGTLADKVEEAIAVANDVVETASSVAVADQTPILKKVARAKKKAAGAADDSAASGGQQEDAGDQASPEPADETQPDPEPEPEPSPSPSEGDTQPQGNEEGGAVLGEDSPLGEI
jgi:hypothetical protein